MIVALVELHPICGREALLREDTVIGRSSRCGLRVDDPLASRRHARLLVSKRRIAIEDLGSANGLYLNGRPVDGLARLRGGDVITLGATVWRVEPRRRISCVV
jgi:S-DNA-T family DNA segregation ATPase FtsK/SpoIIIE